MFPIINPWASYDPDDIPDLNPHCKEDLYDLIFGGCGAIIAIVAYVIIMCLLCNVMITYNLNIYLCGGLMFGCTLIYAVLTIVLMKLGFKISNKIISKKRKQTKK